MSDLPVYNLVEVLSRLPLPFEDKSALAGVSRKWRCVMAPRITGTNDADTEEAILRHLDKDAVPVFLTESHAKAAHDAAGADALAFVQDARWNKFPKPQVAVRGGWGSPGTTLESSNFHKLIGAFDEVFHHKPAVELPLTEEERAKEAEATKEEADTDAQQEKEEGIAVVKAEKGDEEKEVLEMQLFHRDDPQSCPQLPPLGNALVWPSFLDEASAVICDVDTVVSQRGTQRWWRLHDSGELVLQAALPLSSVPHSEPLEPSTVDSAKAAKMDKKLYDSMSAAEKRKPVKLLLFGPKGSYDWFLHDDESTVRGRIACLDLFHTPDEALPKDATMLPVLTVAVLEAGGAPLLMPPNLPCLTLTLNDSVVVSQRRVSHTLWLDEVSYFLHRTAQWTSNPLIYEFIEKDLQDETYVAGELIPSLMELFRRHDGKNPYEEAIRRRVVLSLFTIASNEKHFHMSESSRSSLTGTLGSNADMTAVLQATRHGYGFLQCEEAPLRDAVRLLWTTKTQWPRAGCVLRPPLLAKQARHYSAEVRSSEEWLLPVVYNASTPIYGTEKTTLEETVGEYFEMKELAKKRRELLAYLLTRKQATDELLDELF